MEQAVSYGGGALNNPYIVASQSLVRAENTKGSITGDTSDPYRYDASFNGIEPQRHCTDVCMLTVFLIFLTGMLSIIFVALPKTFFSYLYLPTDYRGFICGYDNKKLGANSSVVDFTNQKYLFWWRPGKKGYVRSACVEKCPEHGLFKTAYLKAIDEKHYAESDICETYEYDGNNYTVKAHVIDPYSPAKPGVCPYSSFLLASRCFPTSEAVFGMTKQEIEANITQQFSIIGSAASATYELVNSKKIIIIFTVFALVLSIVWLLLLKWSAGFFVWVTVLFSLFASGFLTFMCYKNSLTTSNTAQTIEANTFGFFSQDSNRTAFKTLYYVLLIFDIVLVILILFLIDRIKLSIGIIKVVSRVFGEVPMLFLFPILLYSMLLLWWAYIIFGGTVLFGAGKFVPKNLTSTDPGHIDFEYDPTIKTFSYIHLVGFLWGTAFITALGEMTVAGVFASFYFAKEPRRERMASSPIFESLIRSLRYHAGSLAFGSLIVTICQLLRLAIEYFDEKTKDVQNTAVKFLICCMKCCLWCFEKFIKYINRNAYVMIQIHSYSFLEGCYKSFDLILRNIVRASTINWVGDFTLFLGRILISSIVGFLSVLYFMKDKNTTYFAIPSAIVTLLAFFISGSFTSLFEMGIDSCFICYLEDEERNDGSPGREKYAPPELLIALSGSQ